MFMIVGYLQMLEAEGRIGIKNIEGVNWYSSLKMTINH
jgi:hypothetical protein